MTDFTHEKPDRARGEERRSSHEYVGKIVEKSWRRGHTPIIMILISALARSMDVMATQRER